MRFCIESFCEVNVMGVHRLAIGYTRGQQVNVLDHASRVAYSVQESVMVPREMFSFLKCAVIFPMIILSMVLCATEVTSL